ncbi:MAG: RidA family protein [Steroidobacteraceae bacterium]
MSLSAAQIVRVKGNTGEPASLVAVDNLVFVSGAVGTHGDAMAQVDEVINKTHQALAARGLGFGDMVQHTIYIKDGVSPLDVLQRFHGTATTLEPSLKEFKSVGTIVRLPEFPNKDSLVMIDMTAAAPKVKGNRAEFNRIPFTFGPAEIGETFEVKPFVFVAGTEAMDFEHGTLVPTIEQQVDVIVNKLQSSLQKRGMTVGDMISHNLYVRKGTDPGKVIQLFHAATHKLAPQLKDKPSVGTLVIVDGMASDGFLLEMDAVAVPSSVKAARVPNSDHPEIANSIAVKGLVTLSGVEAAQANKPLPDDAAAQARIVASKIHDVLRKSGLGIGDLVKYKIYVKAGANAGEVRRAFLDEAQRLAPALKRNPAAETLAMVEGLAGPDLKVEVSAIAARR